MVEANWARHAGRDCVHLAGTVGAEVRPASAFADAPPMAGALDVVGTDTYFVPRFGFVAGTAYSVTVDGAVVATLTYPARDAERTTGVEAIHPSTSVVPRNLLRCYVTFTAPMSEGQAARHIRLVDADGRPLADALLPVEYELWDTRHRRLTVLLDPARIKRGLVSHVETGYPLRPGRPFRLVVDAGFADARGVPLRSGAERGFRVGADLRGHVRPDRWQPTTPAAGTRDPLVVTFDRPMDRALADRCLTVDGVTGTSTVGVGERSWTFTPDLPWSAGEHVLRVDPVLEDVAGNSVTRVFDRDLAEPTDRPGGRTELRFSPASRTLP